MPSVILSPEINEEKLFKKLHIEKGTEVFNSAYKIIDEIKEFITKNMNISAWYTETRISVMGNDGEDNKMCIICLVSSKDETGIFSREMMNEGNYLKGYLLYEAANHALFEASDRFSRFIREEMLKNGRKLGRRHFAGDGIIDLNMQVEILSILKKEEDVYVYINERNVLFPERLLLYLFAESDWGSCCNEDEETNECMKCKNKKCQYRYEK
nr:hypothetical protein [Sedimentibacter sp.]